MPPDPKPPRRVKDRALLRRFHVTFEGEPCHRCELRIGTQVHHKVFRSQGGSDVVSNLEWLCRECHDEAHGL